MSKYIEGPGVNPALFSGDDILVVVEQAGQRDTYATVNQLRALLDTLPIVGGTANGVLYLNGSKVVTSGSGLTFDGTDLRIGGSAGTTPTLNKGVYLQSSSNNDVIGYSLYINEGSNSRRGSMYLDDAAGVWGWDITASSGVPDYVWKIATFEQMRLTSTGLGIGTSSPAAKLDVAGLIRTGGDATYRGDVVIQQASNTTGSSGGLEFKADGVNSGYGARIQNTFNGTSAYDLSFQLRNNSASWTQYMLLDSSGNLIQTVNTTAATLSTNGTLTFSIVDNSTLRISVRGSDGTTRTATVALT